MTTEEIGGIPVRLPHNCGNCTVELNEDGSNFPSCLRYDGKRRYRHLCRKCLNRQRTARRKARSIAPWEGVIEPSTPIRVLFQRYRQRAKSRGIPFELVFDDFKSLTAQECLYCGLPPMQIAKTQSGKATQKYNGVDRKDSNFGYILENCVSCCGTCNRWKSNLSIDEFALHVKRIARFLERGEEGAFMAKPSKTTHTTH